MPPLLERIESFMFKDLQSLRSVTLGNSIWLIDYGFFDRCESLK